MTIQAVFGKDWKHDQILLVFGRDNKIYNSTDSNFFFPPFLPRRIKVIQTSNYSANTRSPWREILRHFVADGANDRLANLHIL
jgi:hypothetical protein